MTLQSLIDNGTLPSAKYYDPPEPVSTILNFQVGIDGNESSQLEINTSFNLGTLAFDVLSNDSARSALSQVDVLIKQIAEKQTHYGSVYNRLESVIESIGVNIENMTSSLSTIRDADIAEESSIYIQQQILQQASATLMATANQTPAIALQLI